jgi:hypothetical protein
MDGVGECVDKAACCVNSDVDGAGAVVGVKVWYDCWCD